ncbi:AMP-binding protein, partial [Streptomyces lasiicapitis]|uniref:AMP-binding protein n=1 Tax=Streptomyces lasiicapitis TaxID=1923961 RepID=UPI0036AFBC9F
MTATTARTGHPDHTRLSDVALIRGPWPQSAEQAARPALVGPGERTYEQLAAHVAAVAAGLLGLGAEIGDRVAIWTDKQPRYAEAILAALHAGCAYVPLDGGQPVARVETILADAEPVALVTDRGRLAALAGRPLPASVRVVVLTDEGPAEETGPEPASGAAAVPVIEWSAFTSSAAGHVVLLPPLERDDLAAILYTSGSSGT